LSACALALAGTVLTWVVRDYLGWRLPPVMEPHPTFEYRLRPNQDVVRFGKRVVVNEWGMRSPLMPVRKTDPTELRVLVFGDSVVSGVGFSDQSRLATSLLRYELQRKLRRTVNVGNVAAGSWGPANWFGWARSIGFLGADVVVLVASSQDCNDEPEFRRMHPAPRPYPAVLVPMVEKLARWRVAIQVLISKISASDPEAADRVAGRAGRAPSLPALNEFLTTARAAVPSVIVVVHPMLEELDQPPHGCRASIAAVARSAGAEVVDAAHEYRAARLAGATLYHDEIHLADAGQAALQRVLERAVMEALPER
jgi:hypothetical protein